MKDALIVFAKPPVAGGVKTRLRPLLSSEDAARLYGAFLSDALRQHSCFGIPVRLYWAGGSESVPGWLDLCGATLHRQRGAGLGERMSDAFRSSFRAGFERLVIVGTDCPTLPSAYVRYAFAALDAPESVVLGPSSDGGFYLLGMTEFHEELFRGMRYSHARVYEETLARAESIGARVTVLSRWHDVDTPEGVVHLARELSDPGIAAPRTRALLEELKIA